MTVYSSGGDVATLRHLTLERRSLEQFRHVVDDDLSEAYR